MRGEGRYHTAKSSRTEESIYKILWEAGYGWGGFGLVEIARRAKVSELTARRRLRKMCRNGRIVKRIGGYKIDGVVYSIQRFKRVKVILDTGEEVLLPIPLKVEPQWEQVYDLIQKRTKRRPKKPIHWVGGKGWIRAANKIFRPSMPRPYKRPYYTTSIQVFLMHEGMRMLIDQKNVESRSSQTGFAVGA